LRKFGQSSDNRKADRLASNWWNVRKHCHPGFPLRDVSSLLCGETGGLPTLAALLPILQNMT
jgi:hypothetical protein